MKHIIKVGGLFIFVFLVIGCTGSVGKMDCYTNNNGSNSQTICH